MTLTFDIEGDKSFIDEASVGEMDPAAQQHAIVNGLGGEAKRAGQHCCVSLLNIVGAEFSIQKVVCVKPADLRAHVGAVVRGIAC